MAHPPGPPIAALLASLPEAEHLRLANHVGAGLFNGRHAAQCLTDAGTRHHATVPQLLAYLTTAIRELDAARALIREHAEQT